MSKIEQLRKELNDARERLIAKGWKWDGESGNLMDIKPFEIAYQEAIEKVFPDYIWWELTNYWDIFDAMMGGINDKDIIEEIIAHIDPSVLDEAFEETENGAKIESGHTIEEYREKFGKLYDEGELWDFSEEDLFGGAVDINPDIVYWKIEVDGKPRYFETNELVNELLDGNMPLSNVSIDLGSSGEDLAGAAMTALPMLLASNDLEKEDRKADTKLNEGTSNFPVHSDFDLLVFYTYDEFEDMIRYNPNYPNEEDYTQDLGGGDFHVDYDAYEEACQEFQDKMWEENEVCVLDEDDIERLEGKLDDFNAETQNIANERYDYDFEDNNERTYDDLANLEDIKLSIEPGYYEAAYIDVDNEDAIGYMGEAFGTKQRERIAKFLEELRKEFGLTKLGVAWGPASNGETGFKIIKEAKKEPKNKGSKKARFVGNPEAEKTFFNVANGTCTSCALSEAKEESYEEMFDELIDGVEFKLVKYSGEDRKSKSTWDETEYEGDWGLIDLQGANLGGIEDERFNNAKDILERLDTYITDYFLGGQDGLEVSEEHQDELDACYTYEDMLEFFKKYPEEDEDGYIIKLLDFIVNHAKDVDLEKCTFEEFGEDSKGSEVWVLKFINKDGKEEKVMGKPMALDCTKALAQKLVDTMNKYPGRVGMTHEIEKAPYADTMSYEIIDSDDVEEWISKIEAEGEASKSDESLKKAPTSDNKKLKEDIDLSNIEIFTIPPYKVVYWEDKFDFETGEYLEDEPENYDPNNLESCKDRAEVLVYSDDKCAAEVRNKNGKLVFGLYPKNEDEDEDEDEDYEWWDDLEEGCAIKRPAMKHKKLKEAREDSVGWFESVKCYGAPGDEPSDVYEPGQGAYCLVDEDGFLVNSLTKEEKEIILDHLIEGGSQFSIPGTDVEYEIEFAGDCDWDEAYPHILRMFKQGKLNGVFKLDKKQECKEEKTISSRVLKAHRK